MVTSVSFFFFMSRSVGVVSVGVVVDVDKRLLSGLCSFFKTTRAASQGDMGY